MAGKLNHIIPKWMQKGFASRTDGKEVFTWAYRKNKEPFENNTGNSLAENYYYGRKNELNADDVMTNVETNKLSSFVNKLRDGTCKPDSSKTEIAELIAHFSIRTKLVREGFTEMSKKWIGGVREILASEETIETVSDPQVIEDELGRLFIEQGNEELLPILEKFVFPLYQDENFQKLAKNLMGDLFSTVFDDSNPLLRSSIKDGHNKSLSEHTIPQPRVEKYEQLDWSIHETTSTLILGDVACIFREIGEKSFKPSCEINKTGQIYLPISFNQILIGTIDSEDVETDVTVLNEAIASCSYEQFVCSENTKANLIPMIGINAYLVSDEEIENELHEVQDNVKKIKDGQIKL